MFYVIAVIDRRGDDGRLVIDARNGQVVRFVPAYRMGGSLDDDAGPLPPIGNLGGPPRPPASVPQVASRTPPAVPMPKASPLRPSDARPDARPQAAKPASEPVQQSAAVQTKPAEAPATPQAAPPVAEARPAAPQIQPTQEMPKVQGLE